MFNIYVFLSVLFILFGNSIEYEVPQVRIDVATRGFSVSIPDEEGVSLFAFHGTINEKMIGRESGKYSGEILKPRNGRWTYINRATSLQPGDVIYYWLYVDYDDGIGKRGYFKDDQSFTVTGYANVNSCRDYDREC